jgi:hypothetical protein
MGEYKLLTRVPWWQFWNPLSGLWGGLIFGVLIGVLWFGVCAYLLT